MPRRDPDWGERGGGGIAMKRAAILIGVNKTGKLPQLHDAVSGARRMEAWALQQGMARDAVKLFTDDTGPLEVRDIKKAIRSLVDSASIGQLIVYFAGHGVNLHRGEYWLLSDAPVDTQEAVNVEGSVALARRAGIPHVVFISDACRTAAEGIQAQAVTGSDVFPNDEVSDLEQSVDIFFASTLGKPAFEIKDPDAASAAFRALYTDTLLHGLQGEFPDALEAAALGGEAARLVRPRLLKKRLQAEMTRRIAAAGLQAAVNQVPDARITSDDDAWLARLPAAETLLHRGAGDAILRPAPPFAPAPRTLQTVSGELLDAALHGAPPTPRMGTPAPDDVAEPGSGAEPAITAEPSIAAERELDELLGGATRDTAAEGPTHFETGCGFRIEGARVVEALARGADTEVLAGTASAATGTRVRVKLPAGPAASVLLVLEDGGSVLVPAVAEFIAVLRFEDGELADLAYEPAEGSWRWAPYREHLDELHTLRNTIAAAARLGVFRLEGDNALALARRMQYAKGVDPALALYAAYAYHDLQRQDLIRHMADYLSMDLYFTFFDIGLVARLLDGKRVVDDARFLPCVPLLAQGWALLRAFRVQVPDGVQDLQRHLLPSLWTQFAAAGTALLRPMVLSGRIR